MPITMDKPVSWRNADPDELQMLQNLQGNIMKGHGRETTANIFFRFDPTDQKASRRLLRELANHHIVNAYAQLVATDDFKKYGKDGGTFVHVALSFEGYKKIGRAGAAPTGDEFRKGMKLDGGLSDVAVSQWEAPFRRNIHGVVVVAAATESKTAAATGDIIELIGDAGGSIVHVQHGKAIKNAAGEGIEHFGYVDGRSQPLMLVEDINAETSTAGSSRWDPAFGLDAALVPDPGAADPNCFGSFFIFRKLEQHVHDFKHQEQVVADSLGLAGDDRDLAGAMLVGRFEDGTPVTLSETARGVKPVNNFDYNSDPGGRCPFHGHIRKTNPRGSGGAPGGEEGERQHIMPRRGITYEDKKRLVHPDELPEAGSLAEFNTNVAPLLPIDGVGLLFMAYNQNIRRQFKFTQVTWANNPTFPIPGTHGIDPVIGQGPNNPGDQKMPTVWDDASTTTGTGVAFDGFVKMRGGEYFFSPSISFLANL